MFLEKEDHNDSEYVSCIFVQEASEEVVEEVVEEVLEVNKSSDPGAMEHKYFDTDHQL